MKFVQVVIKRSKLRGGNVTYALLPSNILRNKHV